MSRSVRKISECGEDLCPVCSEVVTIFSIGKCGHMICYRCSTRMRVLCDQLYCAICRSDVPEVAFLGKPGKLTDVNYKKFRMNNKAQVYFENENYESAFYRLLEHRCKKCPELKPFRNFGGLKDHMRKEHGLQYCDLCVKHIKLFSQERKLYTRQQLAQHRRVGDADDKSHKGHPLCQFCDDRYLDNDELLRHLRKDHYFCHFCDADGITNQFYRDYNFLKDHFRDSHILCEEGECADAEFTNAFRSEIDYKGHLASHHSKGMRRQQARQARTIDIDFNYSSRYQGRRDRERGGDYEENRRGNRGRGMRSQRSQRAREREELETAQAISASLAEVQRSGHVNVVDQELVRPQMDNQPSGPKENIKYEKNTEDFPTLDGKTMSDSDSSSEDNDKPSHRPTLAKKFAVAHNFSVAHGSMGEEDFPTLGGAPAKPAVPNSRVWGSSKDYNSLGSGRGKGGGRGEGGPRGPPPGAPRGPPPGAPRGPPPQPMVMSAPPASRRVPESSEFPSLSSISSGLLNTNSKYAKHSANSQQSQATATSTQNSGPASSSKAPTNTPSTVQKSSKSNPNPGTNVKTEKPQTEKTAKKGKDNASKKSSTQGNKNADMDSWSNGKLESSLQKANASKVKEENQSVKKTNVSKKQEDYPSLQKTNVSKKQDDYPSLQKTNLSKKQEDYSSLQKSNGPKKQEDYPSLQKTNVTKKQEDYPSLQKASGLKEQEDYPSLQKTNVSKKREDCLSLQKTNASKSNEDYPALSKSSEVPMKPVEQFQSMSTSKVSSQDDYPALGMPAKSMSNNSVEQYPALSKSASNKSPQDDFPALGKTAKSMSSKAVEQYPALSKSGLNKSLQDDFPALGKAAKPQVPVNWGPKGSGTQKDSSESNEQFVTVKTKTNRRRKKNPKGNSKGSSLQGSDAEGSDNELEKFSSTTKHFEVLENLKEKENKTTEVAKKSESEKRDKKQPKLGKSERDDRMQSFEEKAEVSSGVSERYCNGNSDVPLDDFPSLSLLKDQSNLPGFSELTMNDFPVLGGSSVPTSPPVPKPPPGFAATSTNAPPGFAKPPPGFSMPSIHFESQQPESPPPPAPAPAIQHAYSQPNDATIRNQALLSAIQMYTSESDYFAQFKLASGEFRKGQLSALDYYNKCASLIGLDNFLVVFPELLALLPDIPKQQELLAAHNTHRKRLAEASDRKNKNKWSAQDNTFQTCTVCGQVLIKSDYASHLNVHSLDEEFPSLS